MNNTLNCTKHLKTNIWQHLVLCFLFDLVCSFYHSHFQKSRTSLKSDNPSQISSRWRIPLRVQEVPAKGLMSLRSSTSRICRNRRKSKIFRDSSGNSDMSRTWRSTLRPCKYSLDIFLFVLIVAIIYSLCFYIFYLMFCIHDQGSLNERKIFLTY